MPTSSTSGSVRLHGAMGYNNAVYLLNEACSNLYSDESKGITARSINMDDIENAMKEAGNASAIPAPTQTSGTYNSSNSKYPVIYGQEKLSTVNPAGTLGLSEQTRLIERNEGTSTASYVGAITSLSALTRPYQTFYYKDYNSFNTALGDKSNIILPNDSNTRYWVASRCVRTDSGSCIFYVRHVNGGYLYDFDVFYSNRLRERHQPWPFPRSNS